MKLTGNAILTFGCIALGAASAVAQPVISAKSGLVSRAEGEVFIGDKAVEESQTNFPEVKENAVMRTGQGRAEVLLTRGVYMRLGEGASFKMLTNRLIDTRLELLTGSAVVEATEIVKDNNLTILAGDTTVAVSKHGLYRFDMAAKSFRVFDGTASVTVNGQTMVVGAGRMLKVEDGQPLVEKFNKEETDALDNWSKRRAEQIARANPSSAKQLYDAGCTGYNTGRLTRTYWANTNYPVTSPCYDPCGWRYNQWYGLVTYIPCGASIYSPYGYRFWAPMNVMRAYYVPAPPPSMGGNGFGGFNFPTPMATSGGYSGTMSSAHSVGVSAAPAAGAGGTSAASAAGAASAGHGGGGGHGR